MCGRQTAPKRVLVDVVREQPFAVELDHRQPLAVALLQLGVAVDRDLLELEPELPAKRPQLRERPLAEVAPVGMEENNPTDRAPA